MSEFSKIIEWSLNELIENRENIRTPWIHAYADVLISYLQGDLETLEKQVSEFPTDDNGSIPKKMAAMRLLIRRRSISTEDYHRFKECIISPWEGEMNFICGLASEVMGDELEAKNRYESASLAFEAEGVLRKAMKSSFNALACETRHRPQKKYFAQYNHFIRRAKKLRTYSVVGIAYLNISREYQRMGAHLAAIRYATLSIGYLMKYDFASLDYYTALVHRAHVWIDLGRPENARMDAEMAAAADFEEIRGALTILNALHDPATEILHDRSLHPGWRERKRETHRRLKKKTEDQPRRATLSGQLEDRLVMLLKNGPRDKFELMDGLYGNLLSVEVRENRLKNLLNRIRKKSPGLVHLWNGRYEISDHLNLKQA